ncbi:hypothetical protein OE09_2330 [Flavobacteriaceae bacterium MAR_2010_72]|nr:hypothetical protein OE09_2330 [Flavobacteriaceae bacterium MAR_2010_72]TVZ58961.1 hypothetical protein NA63_1476 [Flavobacteriaceae bacterium MAR_2010_105]
MHKQFFEQNNEICAVGLTKARFWKHKVQNMKNILSNSGVKHAENRLSTNVLDIFKNDYALVKNS